MIAMCFKNSASTVFSSAVGERRLFESCLRAVSGFGERPSSDFGRPVVAEEARTVISSALCDKKQRVCSAFGAAAEQSV